jgi:hypothetical protein
MKQPGPINPESTLTPVCLLISRAVLLVYLAGDEAVIISHHNFNIPPPCADLYFLAYFCA